MFPIELGQSTITCGDEVLSVAFVRDVSEHEEGPTLPAPTAPATCILAEANKIGEALPPILRAVCTSLDW